MDQTPNFRRARQFLGPPWLVGDGDGNESQRVWYAIDAIKDALVERLHLGLQNMQPQISKDGTVTSFPDALTAKGRDRRILQGFNESSQNYAARLTRYIDDWKLAGNPFALMKKLAEYCGPLPAFRTVDVRGNWFSRDAQGNQSVSLAQANWDWDASDTINLQRWSRFWVIIYPNGLWTQNPRKWGDGSKWGTVGHTWGSTATVEQVAGVQQIVRDWKPAGTQCVYIILAFTDTDFDPTHPIDGSGLPDGNWGRPMKVVSGAFVPSRNPNCCFWSA